MRAKQKIRIRKSTKYIYIIIAIALMITFTSNLLKNISNENMGTKTKQIYSYKNKFNYDYKVNLIPNKYINNLEESNKKLAYVTDLIENIELLLNYEYEADKESDLVYEYEILGKCKQLILKMGRNKKY